MSFLSGYMRCELNPWDVVDVMPSLEEIGEDGMVLCMDGVVFVRSLVVIKH
ncbi:hypothetical protein DsansV1_C17g0145651 [Dioscorea sansibarensis]